MPLSPPLLNTDRCANRTPESLKRWLIKEFCTCPADQLQLDALLTIEAVLQADQLAIWKRAVAEEILFWSSVGEAVEEGVVNHFASTSPFGQSELSLSDCLTSTWAVALYPLATNTSSPGLGHLWVTKEDPRTYHVDTAGQRTGKSWELAEAMARRALENPKQKERLAQKWVITGQVDGGQVNRVELGNKLSLNLNNRQWLLPRDNLINLSAGQTEKLTIRSAATVDTAWAHINGEESKSGEEEPWPAAVDELHLLVGKNIDMQLASIFLTEGCSNVILWHSDDKVYSLGPAKKIKEICNRVAPSLDVELHELSASNMAQAERTLRGRFKQLKKTPRILFNVTSGNRLMSFSVQTIARLYPNIELIYRELGDKQKHRFINLRYTEFPPYTGQIRAKESSTSIFLDFLYDKPSYQDWSSAEYIKALKTGIIPEK